MREGDWFFAQTLPERSGVRFQGYFSLDSLMTKVVDVNLRGLILELLLLNELSAKVIDPMWPTYCPEKGEG